MIRYILNIFKVLRKIKMQKLWVAKKSCQRLEDMGMYKGSNLLYLPTDGADNSSVYHKATLRNKIPMIVPAHN